MFAPATRRLRSRSSSAQTRGQHSQHHRVYRILLREHGIHTRFPGFPEMSGVVPGDQNDSLRMRQRGRHGSKPLAVHHDHTRRLKIGTFHAVHRHMRTARQHRAQRIGPRRVAHRYLNGSHSSRLLFRLTPAGPHAAIAIFFSKTVSVRPDRRIPVPFHSGGIPGGACRLAKPTYSSVALDSFKNSLSHLQSKGQCRKYKKTLISLFQCSTYSLLPSRNPPPRRVLNGAIPPLICVGRFHLPLKSHTIGLHRGIWPNSRQPGKTRTF